MIENTHHFLSALKKWLVQTWCDVWIWTHPPILNSTKFRASALLSHTHWLVVISEWVPVCIMSPHKAHETIYTHTGTAEHCLHIITMAHKVTAIIMINSFRFSISLVPELRSIMRKTDIGSFKTGSISVLYILDILYFNIIYDCF